jgi:hypothetical protein
LHEFLSSGLQGEKLLETKQYIYLEAAGQKFVPNDERSDSLWPKGTKSPLLLGPFSPFWGVCHSGQGRFFPFLGHFLQKNRKNGPKPK